MKHDITYALANESATLELGAKLANCLQAGLTLYLHGDLGAGKTTLVRGLLHECGYEGKVKSPTYTLVEPYTILNDHRKLTIYHFDLYRFYDPEEWESAGFRDYFNHESICIIEWPEKAGDMLAIADIDITLIEQDGGRLATLHTNSEHGERSLKMLGNA